jgi:hypothetical protein
MFASNCISGGLRKPEIKIAFVDAVARGEANHSRAKQRSYNSQRGQQKQFLPEF